MLLPAAACCVLPVLTVFAVLVLALVLVAAGARAAVGLRCAWCVGGAAAAFLRVAVPACLPAIGVPTD